MKKKALSVVLIGTLLCGMLPLGASAAGERFVEIPVQGQYYSCGSFSEGLAVVYKDEGGYNFKYGYINAQGEEVVPCVYDSANAFSDGVAKVAKRGEDGNQYGYINTQGEEVIPCGKYKLGFSTKELSEGMISVEKDGKYGYVNTQGVEVVPCVYDSVGYFGFTNGLSKAEKDGKYGCVNTQGVEVIPCIYDDVMVYDGAVWVSQDLKFGLFNPKGENLTGFIYSVTGYLGGTVPLGTGEFRDGLAYAKRNGKYGYVNTQGEEVISFVYESAGDFYDGVARVKKDGRTFYINTQGVEVFSGEGYDRIGSFQEGLALVVKDGKCGYINTKGEEVAPCVYDVQNYSDGFIDGVARVYRDGKLGCINAQGEEIIPCGAYDEIAYLKEGMPAEGLMKVCSREYDENGNVICDNYGFPISKCGYVDMNGKVVIPCKYDECGTVSEGKIAVQSNGKYGYLDAQGNTLISCIYDRAGSFSDGLAIVKKNGKWYILKDTEYKAPVAETPAETEATETPTVPTTATATPTGNTLLVDGTEKLPAAYMINDNNYFKLRDVAALLNGTQAQFNIGWDGVTGAITITTGEAYTAVGGELAGVPTDVSTAQNSQSVVYINGQKADLTAYLINDNNYFKLRDLAKVLDFGVSWDGIKGAVLIESDKPYSDAN